MHQPHCCAVSYSRSSCLLLTLIFSWQFGKMEVYEFCRGLKVPAAEVFSCGKLVFFAVLPRWLQEVWGN